jgi:hypothetical protein
MTRDSAKPSASNPQIRRQFLMGNLGMACEGNRLINQ